MDTSPALDRDQPGTNQKTGLTVAKRDSLLFAGMVEHQGFFPSHSPKFSPISIPRTAWTGQEPGYQSDQGQKKDQNDPEHLPSRARPALKNLNNGPDTGDEQDETENSADFDHGIFLTYFAVARNRM